MFTPLVRAFAQFDDPPFLGAVIRSLLWSAAAFAGLVWLCWWGAQRLLFTLTDWPHWVGWLAGILGAAGVLLAALSLFVPVALVIATFYMERIASAVDHRFYPSLPTPRGADWAAQAWDGAVLGVQVLVLQLAVLVLTLLIPGIGWLLGLALAGWAIGRGLFVAVAMRRMPREAARRCYAGRRGLVLAQGMILAAMSAVPLVNLLVPVLGMAAMVHVLNTSIERSP